jgi:limonene-1,2-epoxide hydrolase
MNENEQLIHQFYIAFQQKDYLTMQQCYSDNATFSDEVFINLNSNETKKMWQMLILNGKDLELNYKNISANEKNGSAEWIATYTFSLTKRKVTNYIKAEFEFENGKIVKHKDTFNFYNWAKQALGFTGLLLGWTSFLKNKVQQTASNNLKKFMVKNP